MNIMTKRGSLDNNITYEHFCDTKADMVNINPNYITLGSVCIVINGEDDGMEVYMANSNKEWNSITMSAGSGKGSASSLMDLLDVSVLNPTDGQTLVYSAEEGKWVNGGSTGGVMIVHMAVNEDDGEYVVQVEEQIEDIFAAIRAGKLLGADVHSNSILNEYFYLKKVNISTEYDEYIMFESIDVTRSTGGGMINIAQISYEGSGEEGVEGNWGLYRYSVSIPAEN